MPNKPKYIVEHHVSRVEKVIEASTPMEACELIQKELQSDFPLFNVYDDETGKVIGTFLISTYKKICFMTDIKKNICPFCGQNLRYYDGALGYEAMRCFDCGVTVDNNGIHIEG